MYITIRITMHCIDIYLYLLPSLLLTKICKYKTRTYLRYVSYLTWKDLYYILTKMLSDKRKNTKNWALSTAATMQKNLRDTLGSKVFDAKSCTRSITQSLILGPTLFIIYVNDLLNWGGKRMSLIRRR